MADFSKIGRNNKNRGRAFERSVAEKLGWSRVPYSGAIKEWGGADVVDGFYTQNGLWAAECKTQTPGKRKDGSTIWSLSIKHKWVIQMMGGESGGRHGIIIAKNVGQKKVASGSQAFVFMLEDTHDWFVQRINAVPTYSWAETFTRGKGHNFVVDEETLDLIDHRFLMLKVTDKKEGVDTNWFILTLDRFKTIIDRSNLYIPEQKPDANA